MEVIYNFNGGYFDYKDEVKRKFYLDLYNFVKEKDPKIVADLSFSSFSTSEPYIIGNLFKNYYLEEKVGSTLDEQSTDYFIGYCYKNGKYLKLIPHLITFFALWRDIEGCREENATDFFASSWASLVDTAKFFKYTKLEDLKNSQESPTVQDKRILDSLQNCPEQEIAPIMVSLKEEIPIPYPRKKGYFFLGWYLDPLFKDEVKTLTANKDICYLYAKWGTHTFFHANDGYLSFEELYEDFLADFSKVLKSPLTKEKTWQGEDGWVSDFCKKSKGYLNIFFGIKKYTKKWQWLITFIKKLYDANPESQNDFNFVNGVFVNEDHLRWELNSLFVSRYHLVYPKTKDYSGAGIKEKLALSTNSFYLRIEYPVGEDVVFPNVKKRGYYLEGWYLSPDKKIKKITKINDDSLATLTLYAHWHKA